MKYLLDTNVCVEHLRGRASARLKTMLTSATAEVDLVLCSIVKGELIFGALHSNDSQRNLAKVVEFTTPFASLPFDDQSADEYGKIRADLTARGALIGPNDLMIGAIALANNLTLVTHNVAEFSRVAGLKIEDWQVA